VHDIWVRHLVRINIDRSVLQNDNETRPYQQVAKLAWLNVYFKAQNFGQAVCTMQKHPTCYFLYAVQTAEEKPKLAANRKFICEAKAIIS